MIRENIERIQNNINVALSKRTEKKLTGEQVQLIAVSKTHPAEVVAEASQAGLKVFGENKVQEAMEKIPFIKGASWHLIGHLQTNKVKKAVELFDLIHSVDSEKLLLAVNKEAANINKVQDILLQINIAQEESKFGLAVSELTAVAQKINELDNVRLRGLMVIAPEEDDAELVRPVFQQGYKEFCHLLDLKIKNAKVDTLSMGMSNDYMIAIEEGANCIRLGTLLFGKRDYGAKR